MTNAHNTACDVKYWRMTIKLEHAHNHKIMYVLKALCLRAGSKPQTRDIARGCVSYAVNDACICVHFTISL